MNNLIWFSVPRIKSSVYFLKTSFLSSVENTVFIPFKLSYLDSVNFISSFSFDRTIIAVSTSASSKTLEPNKIKSERVSFSNNLVLEKYKPC